MVNPVLSIGDLAATVGLTARAIRFYVQQKLIPPPDGLGRGSSYTQDHVTRLRRIIDLQSRGHSLDDIRRILGGNEAVPEKPAASRKAAPAARLTAELWTRIAIAPGVEIQFDTGRHNPDVTDLLALKQLAMKIFSPEGE
jgi:DNA-binding transcriptional MerR regulator